MNHEAYFVSTKANECLNYNDITTLKLINNNKFFVQKTGVISQEGIGMFKFVKKGKFKLVYKYGDMSPFIPYPHLIINVI